MLFALIFVVTSGAAVGTLNPTHLYQTMDACKAAQITAADWANTHADMLKARGVDQWSLVCSKTTQNAIVFKDI
jgi:hypothetical protein